jgi:hypothetical protein
MAKPSIFSREYERRMKKRKLRIASAITIILLVFVSIYVSGEYKSFLSNITINKLGAKQTNKENNDSQTTPEQTQKPDPIQEIAEKTFDLELGSGVKLKALYEEKQGVNIFKSIVSEDTAISFIANPSSTSIVILDSDDQSMWAVDNAGKVTEITNQSYSGYKKTSVLKKRPKYIWCTSPKFIDEEHVVYLSQLPRIQNAPILYVWSVNIKDKKADVDKKLSGETIKLGNMVDDTMEVLIGSTTKYIKVTASKISIINK